MFLLPFSPLRFSVQCSVQFSMFGEDRNTTGTLTSSNNPYHSERAVVWLIEVKVPVFANKGAGLLPRTLSIIGKPF